ncbi:MAG: hypothetical protein AB7N76_29560 [Planctomycetota bacterium]
MRRLTYVLSGLGLLGALVLGAAATQQRRPDQLALAAVGLGVSGVVLFWIAVTGCPACQRLFARRSEGYRSLGVRRQTSCEPDDRGGTRWVTREVEEIETDYACRRCAHRWTERSTRSRKV